MSERTTIELKHPIQFGSETITELSLRRGRIGDLKGVKVGEELDGDVLIKVASRLVGQPPKVIELLDEEDAPDILVPVMGFLARCLGGGGTA